MRATLSYTALRLGLFVLAYLLLSLAFGPSLLMLAIAILLSGIVSYFVLTPQRAAMSTAISRRVTGFRHRLDSATRSEDGD
jgi:hypothetical protein